MIRDVTVLLGIAWIVAMPLRAGGTPDAGTGGGNDFACPIDSEWASGDPGRLDADRESIERLMSRWSAAVRAADLETIVSLVTEDCEFWTHGASPLVGRQALADAFGPFLEMYAMDQRFDCLELVISGELAFMRGVEVNHLTPADGGESIVRRQRAFSVLRRGASGEWRFARGMTNLPPDP